jgi:hypothetical protein
MEKDLNKAPPIVFEKDTNKVICMIAYKSTGLLYRRVQKIYMSTLKTSENPDENR